MEDCCGNGTAIRREQAQRRVTPYRGPLLVLECALIAVLIHLLSGCSTTLITQEAEAADPRPVFLLDHGRHTSLVVGTAEGTMVRYAYGDWRFYADQDMRLRAGLAALLWPTPAALARRELSGPSDEVTLLSRLRVGVRGVYGLQVPGHAADKLQQKLDEIHGREPEKHQYVEVYDFVFAPHPEPYTFFNNSNTKVAQWLRSMDVEVRGPALLSLWRLEATR